MIIHRYIKDFESMGLGMFVHFGAYSVLGEGRTVVKTAPYFYGRNYVVRVAKICVDVQ